MQISCAILAGGAAMRFGGIAKPLIKIAGKSILSRILDATTGMFGEYIIVTNVPEEYKSFDKCRLVKDEYLNIGPLGGIHSALKFAEGDAVLVLAGDMPLLDRKIITLQTEMFRSSEFSILVPRTTNLIEPLHSIYSKSVLHFLEDFIVSRNNRSVRDFLTAAGASFLDFPDTEQTLQAFMNINSPRDLILAERLMNTGE